MISNETLVILHETLVILHETHREHWDCTGKMDILESSELFLGVYGLIFEQFPSEKKGPSGGCFFDPSASSRQGFQARCGGATWRPEGRTGHWSWKIIGVAVFGAMIWKPDTLQGSDCTDLS